MWPLEIISKIKTFWFRLSPDLPKELAIKHKAEHKKKSKHHIVDIFISTLFVGLYYLLC